MNRRNFILGLGTAATLSGAAAVTGASASNTVDSTANFQVVATQQLEIRKNAALSDSTMANSGNYSTFLNDGAGGNTTSTFRPTKADVNGKTFPNATVDNGTNTELDIALAFENANVSENRNDTAGFPSKTPYADNGDGPGISPLELVNPGNATDVAVEYVPGGDISSTSERELLAELFQFSINGTRISPSQSDVDGTGAITTDTSNNEAGVGSSSTVDVDFTININDGYVDRLANLASGSGDVTFTGSQTAVDLLDTVRFGTSSPNSP